MKVAKELVTLWNQKSFLQELCAVGLSLLLKDAEETVVRSLLSTFESKIRWEKCSPELLYLLLCLQKRFFKVIKQHFRLTLCLIIIFFIVQVVSRLVD